MNKLYYDSDVQPGQVVSLLDGMEPDCASPFTKSLFDGITAETDHALKSIHPEDCCFHPYPVITPCETCLELLCALYQNFTAEGREKEFSAAAILKKHESLPKIAESLHLPKEYLDQPKEYHFILVCVPRDVPLKPITLPALDETEGAKNYLKKFHAFKQDFEKEGTGILQVKKALDFLSKEAGSHFVSSVTVGDQAIQIFTYKNEIFKSVCSAMDKNGWTGISALAFRYFTSKQFCEYATPVQLLSKDPDFEKCRALLKDTVYHLEESIFRFFFAEVNQELCKLTRLTCVGTELKSVTQWTPAQRKNLHTDSVLTGPPVPMAQDFIYDIGVEGCISKFGPESAGPGISGESIPLNYSEIYSPFSKTDMLSILWSPYLSISQMYVRLDQFWNYPALNKDGVKHFIVTADVIEIQEDVDFSKLESLTLVCRLLICGISGSIPKVRLAKEACKPLELYCDQMTGNCIFEDASSAYNSQLVFGSRALSLENNENQIEAGDFYAGKFPVKIFCQEHQEDTVDKWRKTAFLNGIEGLLSSAYISIYPQRKMPENLTAAARESRKCVKWVDTSIGNAARDESAKDRQSLCRLYARTTMVLNSCTMPGSEEESLPTVPLLRYTAYEKSVNALLALAEAYGKEVQASKNRIEAYNQELKRIYTEEKRDENIQKIAQFMLDQNQAFAQREKDLAASHNEIITKKKETIAALEQRKLQLHATAETYQTALEASGTAINEALETRKAEESSKAAFELTVGVVDVIVDFGLGIYTGKMVSGVTQGIEKTLKKLETASKFVELCGKIIKTSEDFTEHMSCISDLKNISLDNTISETTSLDWEIFMNEMEAQVIPLQDYVKTQVAEYLSILRNLTAVSQSLCETVLQQANLQCEIFEEESRAKVAKAHEKRLKELSLSLSGPDWKPDTDYLADLGQFQAIMQQKQNNVLLKLVDLLRLQDDSMCFHYLSNPTAITQFDILSLKGNISAQTLAALAALERYPYKITDLKKPVEVQFKDVLASDLRDGKSVTHYIGMTHDLFETLAHVRINSLDVRVNGVETDTGKCHVVVETLGNPMHDRGFDREVLSYQMSSQEWHIVYDLKTGETIIGTDPSKEWGQYYTKPSPFQSYRISLPKTSENRGLRFKDGFTAITLSFMVEAAYSPVRDNGKRLRLGNTATPNFITLLKNVSISDGWDAVSFFSIDAINSLWNKRYEKEVEGYFKDDRKFVQELKAEYEREVMPGLKQIYSFLAETSAPRLEFIKDDGNSALIEIPLMKATLTISSFYRETLAAEEITELKCTAVSGSAKPYHLKTTLTKREYEDGKLIKESNDENEADLDKPPLIKTKASLQKLKGELQDAIVYIDPAFDIFTLENIGFDKEIAISLCNEITIYLKDKKLQPWVLGQLKLTADADFLNVKNFDFKTFVPADAQKDIWPAMLGIYILTVTPNPPAHGKRENWSYMSAWPISQELNGAVYFSDDLLWNREIKPALQASIGCNVSIGKEMISEQGNMYRRKANFTGSSRIYSVTKEFHWFKRDEFSGTSGTQTETAKVDFPLSNINFDLGEADIRLSTNCTWQEQFPYEYSYFGPGFASQSVEWSAASFSCSFSTSGSVQVNSETCEVTLGELGAIAPTVTAKVDTHKFFWYDMTADTKKIADSAKTELENHFKNLKVTFSKMPMFAITNILFPESRALLPKGAYFPLDLVIVGKVPEEL